MEAGASSCSTWRSYTLCRSSSFLRVDRTSAYPQTCNLGLAHPCTRQQAVAQARMAAYRLPQIARSAHSKCSWSRYDFGRCLWNGLRPAHNEYSDATRSLTPHHLDYSSVSRKNSLMHVRHQPFNIPRSSSITSQVTADSQVAIPGEEKLELKPAATEEVKRVTAYPFP